MNLFARVLISLLLAAAAWALWKYVPGIPVAAALAGVGVLTALLVSIPFSRRPQGGRQVSAPSDAGDKRLQGTVKWFNVSKGFGFITKDDGEEIFVHFRSIRGEGHRSLRDGQRVSFIEAQTEKGPQAEDVEAL